VRGSPAQTLFAIPTGDVDITHYALSNPGWIVTLNHLTDEFVPDDTCKRIIAFDQFEVGAANPGHTDADKRFAGQVGFGHLAQVKLIVFQP
jgi:hypothetical protein